MNKQPSAYCMLRGSREFRNIRGLVLFYKEKNTNLVKISVSGIPVNRMNCKQSIVSIHIHEGDSCTGTRENPFENAKNHYNPHNCEHPFHAGDLGNLFVNKDGSVFITLTNDRFSIEEIIGKTIIMHQDLDDFKTQPSGNSGLKIACGSIKNMK